MYFSHAISHLSPILHKSVNPSAHSVGGFREKGDASHLVEAKKVAIKMMQKPLIQRTPSGAAVMLRGTKARSPSSQRARHTRFSPRSLSFAIAAGFSGAFSAASVSISQAITGLSITLAGLASAQAQSQASNLPQGGVAVHGTANIVQNGTTLNVNTTNGAVNGVGTGRSIINWQSFNIGTGHTTNINQPNAQSSSLNRVITHVPSQIHGTLRSNGQVILVNQNGIAVGAGGVVDTAGFTASTLNISDADYKANRLRFEGNALSGGVQVDGVIRSSNGDVVLFAPQVSVGKNAAVKADNGNVIVGAGQSVEVTGRGLEGVKFLIQSADNKAINLGTLQGNAVGVFAGTLRHSGVIQAQQATMEGGKVVLRAIKDVEIVRDPSLAHAPVIRADGGVNAQGVAQNGGSVRIESAQGNVTVGAGSQISANAGQAQNLVPNQPVAVINAAGGAIEIVATQGRVVAEAGSSISAQGSPGGTIRIFGGQESRIGALLNVSSPSFGSVDSAGTLQLIGPGQIGGTIQVLSPGIVSLTEGAQLLASGDAGGGTILVGGDYQGANTEIANAQNTNVSQGVLLEASARVNGNGGKVIVWADNTTHFSGALNAQGGERGGDGGFGETSGKKHLYFRGRADLSARRGRTGTLLLDPETLTINGGSGTSDDGNSNGANTSADEGGNVSTNYTIYESDIEALGSTANVILEASRNINFQGTFTNNDLAVSKSLTITTRNGSLDPGTGGISLGGWGNSSFTISAGENLNIKAGTAYTGTVTNAPNIFSNTGAILLLKSGSASGDVSLEAAGIIQLGKGTSLSAANGQVSIVSKLADVTLGWGGSGPVSMLTGNTVTLTTQSADALIELQNGTTITTNGAGLLIQTDRLAIDAASTLTASAGSIDIRPNTNNRLIILGGTTDSTGSGSLQISQAEFNRLNALTAIRFGNTSTYNGNIQIGGVAGFNTGFDAVALLSNGGSITQTVPLISNQLRLSAGSINLNNSTNSFYKLTANSTTGTINIASGGDLSLSTVDGQSGLSSAGAITLSDTSISSAKSLSLEFGANITAEGDVKVQLFETLTVYSGNYTIDSNTDNLGNSGKIDLGTAVIEASTTGRGLTLDTSTTSGVAGQVNMGNVVGNTLSEYMGNLTINTTAPSAPNYGAINLPASIAVSGGNLSLIGRTMLGQSSTLTTFSNGQVVLQGEVQGNQNLTINANGQANLQAEMGTGTQIANLSVTSDSVISVSNRIRSGGNISLIANSAGSINMTSVAELEGIGASASSINILGQGGVQLSKITANSNYNATVAVGTTGASITSVASTLVNFGGGISDIQLGSAGTRAEIGTSAIPIRVENVTGEVQAFGATKIYIKDTTSAGNLAIAVASVDTTLGDAVMDIKSTGGIQIFGGAGISVLGSGKSDVSFQAGGSFEALTGISGSGALSTVSITANDKLIIGGGAQISNLGYLSLAGTNTAQAIRFVDSDTVSVTGGSLNIAYGSLNQIQNSVGHVIVGKTDLSGGNISFEGASNLAPSGAKNYSFFSGGSISSTAVRNLQLDTAGFSATGNIALGNVGIQSVAASTGVTLAANSGGSIDLKVTDADGVTIGLVGGSLPSLAQINTITTTGGDAKLINTLGAIVSGSTAFDIYAGGGNITAKAYGNIGSVVNPLALHGSSFTLGNTGGVVTQTLIAAALTQNSNATLSSSNISIGSYAATLTDIYLAAGVGTTTLKMDNNPGSGNAINLTASNAAGNIIVTQPNVDFSGAGSFTFDALSTEFQTTTNIASGHTVHVTSGNSTIASPGGWLQGDGRLNNAGKSLLVNGTVSPGLSGAIGTLTVSGNLIMGSTGVMDLQIGTNATNGDRIAVNGAFTAINGTLRITESAPGSTATGTPYTLGTSPNFIGTFATLDAPTGIFNRSLGSGFLTVTATSLTNNWINSAGGFWNTGGNWSRGVSPTASHDAVIDMVGFNPIVTVASGAVANSVKIGDTLTLDASLGVMGGMQVFNGGTFNHMNGGSGIITTGNNLSIDSGGVMNWAGGTIGLATNTSQQFNNNGTVNISGPGSSLQNLYLNWNNNGIVAWTGGRRIDLISNASGVINLTNTATGQINLSTTLAGTDDFINGGPGNIINQGTITSASSNAATTTRLNVISNALQNTGKIISNVGTLSIGTAGTLGNDSGSYTVAAGAGLSFAGNRTLSSGASIAGAGQFGVSSGTLTANSGVSLGVLTTGSVSLTGGLNLFIGNAQTIADLMLSAGSNITTGDALSIGTLNAAGGKFSGTGLVTTTGNSTITGQLEREGGNWLNSGNATFNTGGLIYLNNTSTLTNDAAGSMNFLSTGSTAMYSGSGSNRFINQGTLINGAGAVSRQVSVAFDNSGVVNVNSGRLFLDSTTAGSESGTYNVATGATLQINASRNFSSLAAGAGLFGLGFLDIQGGGTQVSLSAGVGTSLLQTGTLQVGSGKLTINTGSGFTFNNTVQLVSGTISHASVMTGAINVAGNSSLTSPAGGTIWTLPSLSTSTLAMASGSTFTTTNSILENFGTVNFSGDGALSIGNSFTNQGVVNLAGNGALAGGVATFNNTSAGTVNRNASGGTFTISSPFAQGGTLNANSGTLAFTNALTNFGLLQGTARLNVGAAGLTNNSSGTIAPGGVGTVGTLTLGGSLTMSSGSKLLIDATSAATYDKLNVTGNVASVAGATISVAEATPFLVVNDQLDVLSFAGTFSGALPTIISPLGVTLTGSTTTPSNGSLRLTTSAVSNFWKDAYSNSNYADALNWSRGHTPTITEDAIINPAFTGLNVTLASGTQTPRSLQLTGDDRLTVNGGILTLAQSSTVASAASLALSSGQINGAGDLNIAGAFNWSGGTMGGTGALLTAGVSTITNAATLQRNWNNTGGITLATGASNSLELQGTATLTNAGSFVVNSTSSGPFVLNTGTALINSNAGTIDWNSGVNSFVGINGQFQNNGLVNVNSGTLRIASPGATDTGIYDIDSGQELQFLGNRTLGVGSNITGAGTVNFAGGTQTINSTVSGGLGIANTGYVRVTASTIDLNTANTTFVNPLTVSGGFVQGSADITIASATGALNWSGGIIAGTGDLITPSGANTTITGAATIQRDWNNAGNITLAASGTAALTVQGAHTLANSGTMQVNSTNATPLSIAGGATVNNTGTINWNTGVSSNISNGTGVFNNNGQFTVSGNSTVGILTSTGNDNGDYSVAAGSRLNFNTGVRSLLAGSDINGAGIVASIGGIVAINDALGIANTGTLRVEGGSMALNSASPITFANPITQTGGTLTGTADITLGASSGWLASGGTFSGAGSLTSVAGSNSQISGAANLSQRNWLNEGIITLDNGASTSLGLSGNADLTNTGTIHVNSQSTGNVISLGTNSDFNNSGIINWNTGKSAGFAGAGNFNNQSAGVFNISGASTAVSLSATGFVQAGILNIGAGSSLIRNLSGNVANTGTLMGAGTINVGSNTLTNSGGTIAPGGIGSVATLTIAGNADLSTGNLLFDLQTPAFSDRLAVTGGVTFGTAPLKLSELSSVFVGDNLSLVTFGGSVTGSLPALDTTVIPDVVFSRSTTASSNGALVASVNAVTTRWKDSPTNQQWTTATNWTRAHVPTASEDVVINPTGVQTVTLTGAAGSARSLALTGNDTLRISGQTLSLGTTSSTIAAGASLELASGALVGATSSLNLAGNLTSTGTSLIELTTFNNFGSVNVSSGTLSLNAFGLDHGTFDIGANATLAIVGRSRLLDSNATLEGDGTLRLNGSGTLLTLSGGTNGNFLDNGTLDINAGNLLLSGFDDEVKFLKLGGNGTLTTASSADKIEVTDSLSANGGNITGPGTLTTSGNSSVTGLLYLSAGNWNNSGNLNFTAVANGDAIEVVNNSVFTNTSSGTISSNNLQQWAIFDGAGFFTGGTVINEGLIDFATQSGQKHHLYVTQFQNSASGEIRVNGSGTLVNYETNFANAGTLTLLGGATFSSDLNKSNNITNTGLIRGNGTLNVGTGTLTQLGEMKPGDIDSNAAVGTLTVMGNLILGENSEQTFDLTTSNSDKINVTGNLSLSWTSNPPLLTFNELITNQFAGPETSITVISVGGNFTGGFSDYSWSNFSSDIDFSAYADFSGKSMSASIADIKNYWSSVTPGGENWFDASKWSRGIVPNEHHSAYLSQSSPNLVTISSGAANARRLIMDGTNNTLSISGSTTSLTVNNQLDDSGTLVDVFVNNTLNLSGGATLALGGGYIYIDSGAVLNLNGATLAAAASGQADATVYNYGLINNISGTSVLGRAASFDVHLENTSTGTIHVQSGDLQIEAVHLHQHGLITLASAASSLSFSQGDLLNEGTIDLSGGILNLGSNLLTNDSAGTIRGTGTVITSELINEGTLAPGAPSSLGNLTIFGNFTNDSSGVLQIRADSANSSDQLIVNGDSYLDGTLSFSALPLSTHSFAAGNVYLPISSTGTSTGGFATVDGIGPLVATGLIQPFNGYQVSLSNPSGSISWIVGDGDWDDTANWNLGRLPQAGDLVIINPSGTHTITVDSATALSNLNLSATGSDDTLMIVSGGQLTLQGGDILKGTLHVSGGTLTNAGSNTGTNAANDIFMSSGQINVGAALEVKTLTFQGGTLNISSGNTLSLTTNGNWNGPAPIIGGGNFYIANTGVLTISGSDQRVITGTNIINDGSLRMVMASGSDKLVLASGSVLTNYSIVSASGGGGVTQVISGDGTLNNQGGTLSVDSNEILNIRTGSLNINGGTVDAGAGLIQLEPTIASYTGKLTLVGGLTQISEGAHTFNDLTLSGGSGTLRIDGTGSPSVVYNDVKLDNYPQLQIYGGTNTIPSGKTLDIASGYVEITSNIAGTGHINNEYYLSITNANITPSVNNNNTLDIYQTVNLSSLTQSSGGGYLQLNNDATLIHGAGSLLNPLGAAISGDGTINVGAGSLTNQGLIQIGGYQQVGALKVVGNANLSSGTIEFDLNSTSSYDKFSATGNITLPSAVKLIELAPFIGSGDSFTLIQSSGGNVAGSAPALSLVDTSNNAVTGVSFSKALSATSFSISTDVITNAWVNTGSGDWSVAANWSRGHIPRAAEDVFINAPSTNSVVSITTPGMTARSLIFAPASDESLAFNSGTLSIGSGGISTNVGNTLFMSSGKLSSAGVMNFDGPMQLSGGQIDIGSTLNSTGLISLNGTMIGAGSGNWNNSGTLAGSGSLGLGAGTFLNTGTISPGGASSIAMLSIAGHADFTSGTVDIDLQNTSNHDKLAITGNLNSGGTIRINQIGTVAIGGGDAFTAVSFGGNLTGGNPGVVSNISGKSFAISTSGTSNSFFTLTAITLAPLGSIFWDGDANDGLWSTASNWSTDLLPASGQRVTINPAGNGSITIASGTNISGLFGLNLDATDALFITGGSLALPGTNLALSGTVNLQGGTFVGNSAGGTIGQLNWASGTIAGSGSYLANTFAFTTLPSGTNSRVLSMASGSSLNANAFTTTMSGGSLSLVSGTFGAGLGMVVGAGSTLGFDGGSLGALSFNNQGTTQINTGNVVLPVTATQTGVFNIANTASLEFSKDTTLAAGASVAGGAWAIANGKTVTSAGSLNRGSGGVTFVNGTLTVGSGFETDQLIMLSGGSLASSGSGVLKVNTQFNDLAATHPITGFGSATLTQQSGNLAFHQDLSVTGAMSLTSSTGEMLSNGGTLSGGNLFAVAASHIELDVANTATIGASSTGGNITLDISGPTVLNALSTSAGRFASVTSDSNIGHVASINTLGSIELDVGANNVSWVNFGNSIAQGVHVVSGNQIQLTSSAATPLTFSGAANSVQLGGGAIQLGSSTASLSVGGPLTVVASGNITQGASLNISGITNLSSTTGDILLPIASSYSGNVLLDAIGTGGTATINSNRLGGINFGASAVNTLNLTSLGPVTQSAPIEVAGLATINAAGQAVNWLQTANDIGSLQINASTLQLADTNGLSLGGSVTVNSAINFGGALSTRVAGFTTPVLNLAALAASSTVNMDVNVSGASSFTAAGGDYSTVSYRNANTGVAALSSITATGSVGLTHGGALPLPSIQAASLSVTAAGPVTQSGTALQIAGNVNVNAAAQNITLTKAGNSIGNFSATGGNIALVSNQTVNPDIDATGSVSITAPNINQSVGNAINSAAFSASTPGGLGLFGNNQLGSVSATAGADINIRDVGASLVLGNLTAAGANGISINATDAVTAQVGTSLATSHSAAAIALTGTSVGGSAGLIQVDTKNVRFLATNGDAYVRNINSQAHELTSAQAKGTLHYETVTGDGYAVTGNISAANVELLSGGNLNIGNANTPVAINGGNSVLLSGANISLAGGSKAGASSSVFSKGIMNVNATGNLVIQGGSANGTFASIDVLGAAKAVVTGTLSVIGGTGLGAYAKLDPAVGSPLDVIAGSVNLRGGTGSGAYAAIISDGNITISANSLNLLAGSGSNADAVIISNFGSISVPGNCNGCVNLAASPLGDGVANAGLFAPDRVPSPPPVNNDAQVTQSLLLTSQLTQIETSLDTAAADPDEDKRKQQEIVVEGQTCP